MPPIRTVVIEDSAFVRKVIREMVAHDPDIEVVGVAKNGSSGLEMVRELKPDVVTCDLNMPELGGVAFVRQQMASRPVPVLIFSASPHDAAQVLDALQAGAVDFIRKPTALANDDLLQIREELCQKIKAAAQAHTAPGAKLPAPKAPVQSSSGQPAPFRPSGRIGSQADIVVIGVSTGGPQALRHLIPQFPANFPVPIAMVLHMPVGYTTVFAARLAEISQIPVKEASDGCPLVPGEALLAQAGRHLTLKRGSTGQVVAQLSLLPTDKPHRPSVDVLFESAAAVYRNRVLGVVMTGMGDDGKQGAAWIKAQGGIILTEAEESCIIYGMPRSVVEAGLSDAAVPLGSLATEISKRL